MFFIVSFTFMFCNAIIKESCDINLQIQQLVQTILLWRYGKESIDSHLSSVLQNHIDFICHQEEGKPK